jgi:hypothetical protein
VAVAGHFLVAWQNSQGLGRRFQFQLGWGQTHGPFAEMANNEISGTCNGANVVQVKVALIKLQLSMGQQVQQLYVKAHN